MSKPFNQNPRHISNKVLVSFWLESGCSQDEGEVCVSWSPINFRVYHELFPGLIEGAANEWLAVNKLAVEQEYEVLFEHVVEHDGGGAALDEYFAPIHLDTRPTEEAPRADIAELVSVLRDINGYHTGLPYPLTDRIKVILAKHGERDA